MARTNTATGGGAGGMEIGLPVVGGTADYILYIDNAGDLFGDANFTRDSVTNATIIRALNGSEVGELRVNNAQVGLTFADGTNTYGIEADTNSLDIRSGTITWTWPSVDGTGSVFTPLMTDGAGGLTFAIPIQWSQANDELVFGSNADAIDTIYWGQGITAAGGVAFPITMTITGRTGNNVTGDRFIIGSGLGTGNAVALGLRFAVSIPTSGGAAPQPLTEALDIDGNRNIRAYGLHNNNTAQGTATQQDIRSGTYTPSGNIMSNVTTLTPNKAQWLRVGNVVTVAGTFVLDPTNTGNNTQFRLSLPVSSNFGTTAECAGCAVQGTVRESIDITANIGNDQAQFTFTPVDVASRTWSYTFTYEVI